MDDYFLPIVVGGITGVITRLSMLKSDYRQYPTYLHGKIIHLALGVIAAGLGSIVVPALLLKEYTAITFLTVAASQFREVRNMERNTLTGLDQYELVKRGNTYIEGIAIAFEGRNYLVIFTSMITTAVYLFFNIWAAIITGVICIILSKVLMSGSTLKDIVDIEYMEPRFDGAGLYVDNIYIMNIGLPDRQEEILRYGMGFILKPKNFNVRTTIANLGQRQAILHDTAVALGVYRDSGTPALVPLAKRDLDDGRVAVFILPQEKNIEKAIKVIGNVPTLENAIRLPSKIDADEKGIL
ncbi:MULTISPECIES: YIEGIA family protein [Bacillus]|uniref:YIEGIA family protein n=1 Tax=Bacillus TaxID=1386 RepID=UPI0002F515BA|nr:MULTISPECIES: YIEGIA family protein [Bacillus]